MAEAVIPTTGEIVSTEDVQNAVASIIAGMNAGNKSIYSTLDTDDWESKTLVFSALTNSEAVDDNLGKTIQLRNFVAQSVDIIDSATNQEITVPRVVLIDADGNAYHCISGPILLSLRNLVDIFGQPKTWPQPVPVTITKEKGKRGSFFRLALVQSTKK